MNYFQKIDSNLLEEILKKSIDSPRKRANHNFHVFEETYQRFLNVLLKGTYVAPHKHENPDKAETFLIIKGRVGFLLYDESGTIIQTIELNSEGPVYGVDIQPGVWHSLVCLSDSAVCFEGKTGPYNPDSDKYFADWAPKEGEPCTAERIEQLESLF
jgi:cupin fold WbuC family metalloprotein